MKDKLPTLVAILLIVATVGYVSSPEYTIQKTTRIRSSPEAVHEYISDVKNWAKWAPWYTQDPTVQTTYGLDTVGRGARAAWTGAKGEGQLVFTGADPNGIAYDMTVTRGDTRTSTQGTISLRTYASAIEVNWTVSSSWRGVVPRVVDGWMKLASRWTVGSDLEDGLQRLKELIEAGV